MLLSQQQKDILDNPAAYIQAQSNQNKRTSNKISDEKLFEQMDSELKSYGYDFTEKNSKTIQDVLTEEDSDKANQYKKMGPIDLYEGAKREARENNGVFEFSETYGNVLDKKKIERPADIKARENFQKLQEEVKRKKLERNKRVNEGPANIGERIDAFFDRMANNNIQYEEERAKINAYRQGVGKPNTRTELMGYDKTGQALYNVVDLTQKIGFCESFSPAFIKGTSVGSFVEGAKTKELRNIKNKMIEGEPIYKGELDFINKYYESEKEKQLRGYTLGGKIGEGVGKSLGFAADFVLGGWALKSLGVGKFAGTVGLKSYLGAKELGAASSVAKGIKGITELGTNGVLGAAVMTAVNSPLRLFPEYQERMLGNEAKLTDSGNMIFQESDEKPATALMKSLGGLYISYLTELAGGEALSGVAGGISNVLAKPVGNVAGGAVGRILSANPALKNFLTKSTKELSKRYETLRNMPVVGKSTGWIKDTVHFDGFLEEMGEEALEDVLRLTAGIDNQERSFENYQKAIFKTPEEWAIIAGTIILQGAGLSAVGYTVARNMASSGATEEEIVDVLTNTSEQQKKEILDAQIENGMTTIPNEINQNEINKNIARANYENLSEDELDIELKREEIEEKMYNTLLKGKRPEAEAISEAKLMGQFFKRYGAKNEETLEKFNKWFEKLDVQYNVPVGEIGGLFQDKDITKEDKIEYQKLNGILQERLPNYNSIEEFYRDYSIIDNLTKNGATINPDGTVTLYHAGNVQDILKDGKFKATTAAKGGMTGYNSKSVFFGFDKEYVKKWSSNGTREITEIKVPFEYIKQAAQNKNEVYLDGDVVLADKEKNIWIPQDKIQDNFYTQLPALKAKAKLNGLFKKFNKKSQEQTEIKNISPADDINQRTDKTKYLTDNEVEQLKKDTENFATYVDKLIKNELSKRSQLRILEKLPSAYNNIPALKGKKVVITQDVYKKIIDLPNKFNKNHNVDRKRAVKLPQLIADPLYILKSNSKGNEHRFVVVTSSKNNVPAQRLSVFLNPNNSVAVVSAYDEEIDISKEKKAGRVLYDKKKELSKTILTSKARAIDNSNNIIPQNLKNKTFFQSAQNFDINSGIENNFSDSVENITEGIRADIQNILDENNISADEFKINDIRIYGSYATGQNKNTSDIDFLVEYSGTMREDDAFNIFSDAELKLTDINGKEVNVDINPIRKDKSGTIDEFLERNKDYRKNYIRTFFQSDYNGSLNRLDGLFQKLFQKKYKKVAELQKEKKFEKIKNLFDDVKNVEIKELTKEVAKKLNLNKDNLAFFDRNSKTIYINYGIHNRMNKTALSHSILHEVIHAKQNLLYDFAKEKINSDNVSENDKSELIKYINTIDKCNKTVSKFVQYIQAGNYSNAEQLDTKGKKLYDEYKYSATELDADNFAIAIQAMLGERNEETELQQFDRAIKSIFNSIYFLREQRDSKTQERARIESIKQFNARQSSKNERLSDYTTYYQESDNEPRIAGYTYNEVGDKLASLYEEQSSLPENDPKLPEVTAKIHILEDAYDAKTHPEDYDEDKISDIMMNAYYIMNDQEIPQAVIEQDSYSDRTYNDLKKLHEEKKEEAERKYLGYFTESTDKNIITIMADSNASTALHELGHLFLNGLNELAKVNEEAREQLNEFNKWLGYTGGEYTKAQQEKFARSFEAYLYKGKAPNNKLRTVFENYKEWLKSVYEFIMNIPDADISDEVQEMFDKMFSDDGYYQEKKEADKFLKEIKEKSKRKKVRSNKKLEGLHQENTKKTKEQEELAKRHKDISYDILSVASGKSVKYLKSIFETDSDNIATAKKRDRLAFELGNTQDEIKISDGMRDEWLEFYSDTGVSYNNAEIGGDYELAMQAFNTILNKNYGGYDLDTVEEERANYYEQAIDEADRQYKFIIDEFRKAGKTLKQVQGDRSGVQGDKSGAGNKSENGSNYRNVVLSAFYDWVEGLDREIKNDYENRFIYDTGIIERNENLNKFEKAKQEIIKKALSLENKFNINSNEKYREVVKEIMKNLNFLSPQDKAKLTVNILDYSDINLLMGRIDNIMDIAKTMEDIQLRRNLERDIHSELQKTKNIKKSGRTVGKYDYRTNKLFEELRELDKLSPERANELRLEVRKFSTAEDKGMSYKDKIVNKFLSYKANGRTYADTDLMKELYDEILKIKLIGKSAKSELELMEKLGEGKDIEELIKIVEKKKEAGKLVKNYVSMIGNLESTINAIFGNKIKEKYASEILYAETQAQAWQYQIKSKFEESVAKIYKLPLWMWDKKIIDYLSEKHTYSEIRRKYNEKGELIKARNIDRELTKMDIIQAYIWSKNEVLEKRLINQFGEETLENMFDELSNEDVQLAELLIETASSFYPMVNKASIQKYGLDLPKVSCYFPSTPERGSEVDLYNEYSSKSLNNSFTKQRAQSEIVPMDFHNPITTLYSHIDGVAKFAFMSESLDRANLRFKDTDLKRVIINKFGEDVYRTLEQCLINVTYKKEAAVFNGMNKIIDNMVGNWIQANVAIKPIVGLKQLLSANNYAVDMPYMTWQKGFLKALAHPVETINYMMKIPYIEARFKGNFSNEFLKQQIENSAFATSKKLKDLCTLFVKIGDIGAIIFGGKPYIDYQINQKGLTEEEAIKQFILSTNRSQQSSAVSSLSNFQVNMTRNPVGKLFIAFKNSPQQYIRMCGDAIISATNGDISKKQAAKLLFQFGYLQPLFYAVATSGSLLRWLFADDDEDLLKDLSVSLFNLGSDALPIIGDIYKYTINKMLYKEKNLPATTPLLGDIEKEINRISKEDVTVKDYLESIGYLGLHVGLGYNSKAIGNTFSGVGDIFTGEPAQGTMKVLGYTKKRAEHIAGND